jgi:hypothetical protein
MLYPEEGASSGLQIGSLMVSNVALGTAANRQMLVLGVLGTEA